MHNTNEEYKKLVIELAERNHKLIGENTKLKDKLIDINIVTRSNKPAEYKVQVIQLATNK